MAAKLLKKAFPTCCRKDSQNWYPRRVLVPRRGVQGQALLLPMLSMSWPASSALAMSQWATGASGWTFLPEGRVQSPRGSPKSSCAQVGCAVSCVCPWLGLDVPSRRCQHVPAPNNGFIHSCFPSSKALAQTFRWFMLAELVQGRVRPLI